jgi:hypothetical protein
MDHKENAMLLDSCKLLRDHLNTEPLIKSKSYCCGPLKVIELVLPQTKPLLILPTRLRHSPHNGIK